MLLKTDSMATFASSAVKSTSDNSPQVTAPSSLVMEYKPTSEIAVNLCGRCFFLNFRHRSWLLHLCRLFIVIVIVFQRPAFRDLLQIRVKFHRLSKIIHLNKNCNDVLFPSPNSTEIQPQRRGKLILKMALRVQVDAFAPVATST